MRKSGKRRRSRQLALRTKQHVRFVQKIMKQIQKASPKSSRALATDLAIDLGDLASVAQKHLAHVRELLRMTIPRDREKFQTLLAQFDVNLLFEGQWHLKDLKRLLPRIIRDVHAASEEGKKRNRRYLPSKKGRR